MFFFYDTTSVIYPLVTCFQSNVMFRFYFENVLNPIIVMIVVKYLAQLKMDVFVIALKVIMVTNVNSKMKVNYFL